MLDENLIESLRRPIVNDRRRGDDEALRICCPVHGDVIMPVGGYAIDSGVAVVVDFHMHGDICSSGFGLA